MKKIIILGFMMGLLCVGNSSAKGDYRGHVTTIFGEYVYDAFGACVHTIFYNPATDAIPECGEVSPNVQKSQQTKNIN